MAKADSPLAAELLEAQILHSDPSFVGPRQTDVRWQPGRRVVGAHRPTREGSGRGMRDPAVGCGIRPWDEGSGRGMRDLVVG